jgi:hypothetical protein
MGSQLNMNGIANQACSVGGTFFNFQVEHIFPVTYNQRVTSLVILAGEGLAHGGFVSEHLRHPCLQSCYLLPDKFRWGSVWHPQCSAAPGESEPGVAPELMKDINRNFQSFSFYYRTGLQKEQLVLNRKSMSFIRYQVQRNCHNPKPRKYMHTHVLKIKNYLTTPYICAIF